MALISLHEISLNLSGAQLFEGLSLQLEPGERVALLGRNGTGKTTLMKLIAGLMKPDGGKVDYSKGIQVAHLPQEVPALVGTVFDVVLSGLESQGKLLHDFHEVSHRLETEYSDALLNQLGRLQSEMDRTNAWETHQQIENTVAQMKLDPESRFEHLSGGQKRRALLAKALALKPNVLLLDEPTNHLDLESIEWLENFLKDYSGTLLFVTHDRMFMARLATRIMELDRGKLYSWACDYRTFLERKQNALEIEAVGQALFDKKLAQEEAWVRQGVKARRTRSIGRVRALEELRAQKKAQRQMIGKVRMQAQEAERSGQVVVKAEHIEHGFGEELLIRNFSTRILKGDKIGVMGPNGSGKTTLLRILLGQTAPQKGTVALGTNLQIAYYDQLREQLDENKSVKENICGEGESVTIDGRSRNVMGYLQDFLFAPERARTPVRFLSGGERNRLFLARLFTKPSNLLVLDEPTNDLDIETLELLEELLVQYSGTILLVSHDRAFLNNVVTSTLVLEGEGRVHEYPGGYDDWLIQRPLGLEPASREMKSEKNSSLLKTEKPKTKDGERKLSFNDLRELESLPVKIEELDARHEEILKTMADPNFYQKDPKDISEIKLRLAATADDLSKTYQRWEHLDRLK